jgi:hypothetical protein
MSTNDEIKQHIDDRISKYSNHSWIVWGYSDYPYLLCSPVEEKTSGRYEICLYGYGISKEKFENYEVISGREGVALYKMIDELREAKRAKQNALNAEANQVAATGIYKLLKRAIVTGSSNVNAAMTAIHAKEELESKIYKLARQMYVNSGGVDWEHDYHARNIFAGYARTAFEALNKE